MKCDSDLMAGIHKIIFPLAFESSGYIGLAVNGPSKWDDPDLPALELAMQYFFQPGVEK